MSKAKQLAEKLKKYMLNEYGHDSQFTKDLAEAIEYLSQNEQEPVAWASPNVIPLRGGKDNHPAILTPFKCEANTVALYTALPKRKPLSDEEIKAIENSINKYETLENGKLIFARAIEKAHGIGVGND